MVPGAKDFEDLEAKLLLAIACAQSSILWLAAMGFYPHQYNRISRKVSS